MPSSRGRVLLALAAVNGFLAVLLGAFGAHALRSRLVEDVARRLTWWETAQHYHLFHALALAVVGLIAARASERAVWLTGSAFGLGILLFSGSLYLMALTGARFLGAVTPVGGLCLLLGWVGLVWTALSERS